MPSATSAAFDQALSSIGSLPVSDNRKLLASLKRQLKQQPARTRAVLPEPAPLENASELFRQATLGVKTMPSSRQADIQPPRPRPIPRPRSSTEQELTQREPKRESWIPTSWLNNESATPPLSGEAGALAEALRGAKPIVSDKIISEAPKPLPLPIQHELDERAALAESIYAPTSLELRLEGGDELHYLCNGVPRSVLRDLRRGRWVVQESVDLHGCNREEARELLASCMAQWRKQGSRCVRVVHGKGRGSPGKDPILKKLVAGWLMNYENVAAYCQARLAEGGAGALIILLKAPRPTAKP